MKRFLKRTAQGFIKILDDVYQTGKPYTGREMPFQINRGKGIEQIFITFICQVLKDTTGKTEGILAFCYEVIGTGARQK